MKAVEKIEMKAVEKINKILRDLSTEIDDGVLTAEINMFEVNTKLVEAIKDEKDLLMGPSVYEGVSPILITALFTLGWHGLLSLDSLNKEEDSVRECLIEDQMNILSQ